MKSKIGLVLDNNPKISVTKIRFTNQSKNVDIEFLQNPKNELLKDIYELNKKWI